MKKLFLLTIILLPILASSQGFSLPLISLKTMEDKYVMASELVKDNQSALIYFFNENSSQTVENLEYLQALSESPEYGSTIRVIAVYNPMNGSYRNLNAFLHGQSIYMETYIDVNGELQRSMGLPANSTVLVSGMNLRDAKRFSGSMSCSGELASLAFGLHEVDGVKASDESRDWAQSSYAK